MSRLLFSLLTAVAITAVLALIAELGSGLVSYTRENPDEAALWILIGLLIGS